MQSLNDDMEELYRKAAENYPLNTGGADWDKVMPRIQPTGEEVPPAVKERPARQYGWLLLLIPFILICHHFIQNKEVIGVDKSKQQPAISKAIPTKKEPVKTIIDEKRPTGTLPIHKNIRSNVDAYTLTTSQKNYITHHIDQILKQAKIDKAQRKVTNEEPEVTFNKNNKKESAVWQAEPENVTSNNINKEKGLSSNNSANPTSIAEDKKDSNKEPTKAPVAAIKEKESIKNETEKVLPVPVKKAKKWYAGLTFGPDVSMIKGQSVQQSGYSAGLVAGYHLNDRISLETGAIWDKKSYYSSGDYFNTSKISVPYNVKIIDVSGTCYMIEIPVNVQYHFKSVTSGSWYVSAGASTYLMKKEDYTYLYDHSNVLYDVYKEYKNSSKDWFSIVNIGLGYQHPFLTHALIRVEPYVKLPLSGVGIGHLPISSMGVMFSITRPVK